MQDGVDHATRDRNALRAANSTIGKAGEAILGSNNMMSFGTVKKGEGKAN